MKPILAIFQKSLVFFLVVLLFLVSLPQKAEAKRGYNLNCNYYSFTYGFQTVPNQNRFHKIELTNSYSRNGCIRLLGPFQYCSFGANYSFNHDFDEWGILVNGWPFNTTFLINREHTLIPVIYTQFGFKRNKAEVSSRDINSRVGLGLDGVFLAKRNGAIRSSIQVGYIFNDSYITNQSGFTFELKVGYGIHSFKRRKKSEKD